MIRPRDRSSAAGLLPLMEARPRKNGLVTYRYHPRGGKPISLGTDKTEAIRKVLDMNGATPDVGTLQEVWRSYQAGPDWKRLAPRTRLDYEKYSVELLKVFGNVTPAMIRPTDISRYLRKERAKAPIRANREVALLSNLMNFAVERGDLETNPCKQVRRNPETPRTEAPEPEELGKFATWVTKQTAQRQIIGMMAEFAALAGSRRMEFLDLSWPQIDEAAGIVRIHRGKQRSGKVKVETIGITPPLQALIDRLRALPRKAGCLAVFTTRDGNAYTESAFTTLWGRLMRDAMLKQVLERRFTFHDLRAYYTTQHKAQYGSLPELHNNPAVTAAVYDRSRVVARKGLK